MVVDGASLMAYGEVQDGAELTCEIYSLVPYYEDGEFLGYVMAETPLRSATCASEDIYNRDPLGNSYLDISFSFDEPLVIDDTYPSYVIKISGFNDEKFTYFGPIQQLKPNEDNICMGWIEKEISYLGSTRSSLSPLANYVNEYGEMYSAFAINLKGYFPGCAAMSTRPSSTTMKPWRLSLTSSTTAPMLPSRLPNGLWLPSPDVTVRQSFRSRPLQQPKPTAKVSSP